MLGIQELSPLVLYIMIFLEYSVISLDKLMSFPVPKLNDL